MVDLSDGRQQEADLRRRFILAVFVIIGIVVTYFVIYHWAIVTIAGIEDRSPVKSLQVVIEALTTAGFGGDAEYWAEHAELAFMILVMNLTGVLLVFFAIPLFGVPLFRNAIDRTPPTTSDLRDHVIICGYSATDDVLIDELEDDRSRSAMRGQAGDNRARRHAGGVCTGAPGGELTHLNPETRAWEALLDR